MQDDTHPPEKNKGEQPVLSPAPAENAGAAPRMTPGSMPDLGSILLPKKEAPSATSQSRVNAAVVLEAANAALGERPQEDKKTAQGTPPAEQSAGNGDQVVPLRTYKGDIEDTVHTKNISLADIASAQAQRGRSEVFEAPAEVAREKKSRLIQIAAGTLLVFLTMGVIIFITQFINSQTISAPVPLTSYIYVDDTRTFTLERSVTRSTLMQALETERGSSRLSLGLVARLYPIWVATTTTQSLGTPLTTQEFFAALSLNAPESLMRALSPGFLLGVHAFDGNQSFLLLKTDSYEQMFAGMLQWETRMQDDLAPLFDRSPRPRIPEEGNTAAQAIAAPQLLETPFADRVVENHDARVIQNKAGDILLLWTFINRGTFIITTNEYTLREVISRLAEAPVIPIPGEN